MIKLALNTFFHLLMNLHLEMISYLFILFIFISLCSIVTKEIKAGHFIILKLF